MIRRWLFCALVLPGLVTGAGKDQVRQPAVAGTFYPGDAKELAAVVDGFLAKVSEPAVPDLVALVSPHAGYPYSGGVAAYSYALLKGKKYTRVVVIAPSHVDAFGFSSVYDGAAYATPLGRVPVDRDFAAKLAGKPGIKLSSRGHQTGGERGEHALEVQLPFLQRTLGQFQLVPVVMGDQSYDACRALGLALARLIQGNDTLIVASSDLSHFHSYEEAVKLDRKTLQAIEEWDYLSMARNFESQTWEACGGGPIVAAMIAAERLGATRAKVLKYANSGDVTSDRTRVVGYGAVAISKAPHRGTEAGRKFDLTAAERAELLHIARKSVEAAVKDHKLYDWHGSQFPALMQERGAFVTLKKHGQLRGCIGYPSPIKPLGLTVRDVAAMAAVQDSRFRPVTVAELDQLEYEISVLSPLRRVLDIKQIQVGRHGLVMKQGRREGLLLPQVPVEQGWDLTTFLDETCLKAGLPQGAWKDPETDIFMFTSLVFGESTPRRSQ
jgi:AmmeMemoRadiSam system protein B/AmmeMemoRadiSam system protein A